MHGRVVTDLDGLRRVGHTIRDHVDWRALAQRETALFRADMQALRVLPMHQYVGAVEAIPEITEAVAKLLANGAAYRANDGRYPDVYFDHAATQRFGSLSHHDEPTMTRHLAERGGDPDRPGKRHPLDALLWRMARPGEPRWDSELGPGRPGWLIFPHHE